MTGSSNEMPPPQWAALDRHALAMSIWFAVGFVAFSLITHGVLALSPWAVAGGFAAVFAGFVGHVIINAVCRTTFTVREIALGLVVYVLGLVWFLLSMLVGAHAVVALFLPFSVGFLAILVTVVFYMVTHFGVRGAFDAFDVVRSFRA